MSNHETDGVGFFFGVLFLVCAAAAIALRTVPLGESADGGVAVAAAVVLLVAGVVGIGGSLRHRHRRVDADDADADDVAGHDSSETHGAGKHRVESDQTVADDEDRSPTTRSPDSGSPESRSPQSGAPASQPPKTWTT